MYILPKMFLEVCNACTYECKKCAHKEMRDTDINYQLDLDSLNRIIAYFKKIECTIDELHIHGAGEPLLWKHFNEAIRILKKSKINNKFVIFTNGLLLNKIADDVWDCLHHSGYVEGRRASVLISKYPGKEIDKSILDKYSGMYEISEKNEFWETDVTSPLDRKYECHCSGPTCYKERIYPHCGPPLFAAAEKAKLDPYAYGIPLNDWDPQKQYHLDPPCRWCWVNIDLKTSNPKTIKHEFK